MPPKGHAGFIQSNKTLQKKTKLWLEQIKLLRVSQSGSMHRSYHQLPRNRTDFFEKPVINRMQKLLANKFVSLICCWLLQKITKVPQSGTNAIFKAKYHRPIDVNRGFLWRPKLWKSQFCGLLSHFVQALQWHFHFKWERSGMLFTFASTPIMLSMKLVIPLHLNSWKKDSKLCCDTTMPESIYTKDEMPFLVCSHLWCELTVHWM